MEMMNRAIEAAADFRGFMEKVQRGPDVECPPDAEEEVGSGRQPGENREMHRARLKAERRAAPLKVPR